MRLADLYEHVGGRAIPHIGASLGLSVLAVDLASQPRPLAIAAMIITSLGYLAKLAVDLNVLAKFFRSYNAKQDARQDELEARVAKLEGKK